MVDDSRSQQAAPLLARIEALLARGITSPDDIVTIETTFPTALVGNAINQDVFPCELGTRDPAPFSRLFIVQIDLFAPSLVAADSVQLRIFRRTRRRLPDDLVADFTGASQLSAMWIASFTGRQINYRDQDQLGKVYLSVTNQSGNSGPSDFTVTIYAHRTRR